MPKWYSIPYRTECARGSEYKSRCGLVPECKHQRHRPLLRTRPIRLLRRPCDPYRRRQSDRSSILLSKYGSFHIQPQGRSRYGTFSSEYLNRNLYFTISVGNSTDYSRNFGLLLHELQCAFGENILKKPAFNNFLKDIKNDFTERRAKLTSSRQRRFISSQRPKCRKTEITTEQKIGNYAIIINTH